MLKPLRKSISLLLLFALIIEIVSGIVLYAGPLAGVARMSDWQFLGLQKPAWDDLHTSFGLVMLLTGLLHLLLNGRAIIGYIRCRVRGRITRSFIAAIVVTLLVGIATVERWEPIDSFLEYGVTLRRGWIEKIPTQQQLPPAMREMLRRRMEGRTPPPLRFEARPTQ